MVFKQSFKYLKNVKINFIKVILKLECFFYQNIYIFYFILFYIFRAIFTQTNPKKGLIEKKTYHIDLATISNNFLSFQSRKLTKYWEQSKDLSNSTSNIPKLTRVVALASLVIDDSSVKTKKSNSQSNSKPGVKARNNSNKTIIYPSTKQLNLATKLSEQHQMSLEAETNMPTNKDM